MDSTATAAVVSRPSAPGEEDGADDDGDRQRDRLDCARGRD